MKRSVLVPLSLLFLLLQAGCREKKQLKPTARAVSTTEKIRVILDTDANNELDDQHAMAYLLFNSQTFDASGITVNATYNGGDIQGHYDEAERIIKLSGALGLVPLYKGANLNFDEISDDWDPGSFDGQQAVDFILEATRKDRTTIVAVGKLTNVALALKKDPSLAGRTRVVWLGSNYPDPGEYNQDNDTVAMNYLLNSNIPFEMVTVRYGKTSGTDAVRASLGEINSIMPGLGPVYTPGVNGRHGGTFHTFGDYSVDLFNHIDLHGDPPSRALFDMVALAILKHPAWARKISIAAPILIDGQWRERPANQRLISIWENFDKGAIMADFFESMQDPQTLGAGN